MCTGIKAMLSCPPNERLANKTLLTIAQLLECRVRDRKAADPRFDSQTACSENCVDIIVFVESTLYT